MALHDGGIVVAFADRSCADEARITVRLGGEAQRMVSVQCVTMFDGVPMAHAVLDPSVFETPGPCTVTVTTMGRSYRKHVEIGPGRFTGEIEGVRNYRLEGWVSPLFPETAPSVQLLVDGIAGDFVPLDCYRREFQLGSRGQGGWNGFRLPLPMHALDGKAHRLAIKAGGSTLDFGPWSAKPKYFIDTITPTSVVGWYFDESAADAPTLMRIVRDGVTQSEVRTHFRDDLKAAFGRDYASFAVRDHFIQAGSLLVAGPDGTGIVLGTFGADRLERIAAKRVAARAALLELDRADETLRTRLAIREHLVANVRAEASEQIAFIPMGDAGVGPGHVMPAAAAPRTPPPVCALVPVYKGLSDLKCCLESLISQLRVGQVRALVINDCSPEPEVGRYLAELTALRHPGLTILENSTNLGFIGTVNRGFSLLEPGEDVLLVNADTILPLGAVERLARHCHTHPGIASVTPMSNNATILSFPYAMISNQPALGLDVAEIDRAFVQYGAAPVEIPTGIGFCMHLNRRALDEVGSFSPEWGRGYCEEVDWCLTARDLGWIHLAATDTFVVHEGSVSFGAAERITILQTNHVRLEGLYPEYLEEIRAFERNDPFEDLRTTVMLSLLAGRFKFLTLHLTHGLGGGTQRYVDDMQALPRTLDHEVAVLRPVNDRGEDKRIFLRFDRADVELKLRPDRIERVLSAIEAQGVDILIHVNSRLTFGSAFLQTLLSGSRPYIVMLHDFQWYCPRVHLMDERHFYCGEPKPAVCQYCVSGGVDNDFGDQTTLIEQDLDAWLGFNEAILRGATMLLAPSNDTAERYRRRFELSNIAIAPHPEPRPQGATRFMARRSASPGVLRVAVVGAIGVPKGFDVLVRLVERAARDRAPFFLTVIGFTPDDGRLTRYQNAEITGSYKASELGTLLTETDPDFVFLSSVWPETYSYVLSEIWETGYPVVAFDIGAPADRIRTTGGGILIPMTCDTPALLESLMVARDRLVELGPMSHASVFIPSLEAYYAQWIQWPVTATGVHVDRKSVV